MRIPIGSVINFAQGVHANLFDINPPVITDADGLVYSKSRNNTPKVRKLLYDQFVQKIMQNKRKIVKIDEFLYNIKISSIVKVFTFVSVRDPFAQQPKTVMVRFPEALNDLISQTDTFALVLKKDLRTVKTIYPVLPLVYLPQDEVEKRVQRATNPS